MIIITDMINCYDDKGIDVIVVLTNYKYQGCYVVFIIYGNDQDDIRMYAEDDSIKIAEMIDRDPYEIMKEGCCYIGEDRFYNITNKHTDRIASCIKYQYEEDTDYAGFIFFKHEHDDELDTLDEIDDLIINSLDDVINNETEMSMIFLTDEESDVKYFISKRKYNDTYVAINVVGHSDINDTLLNYLENVTEIDKEFKIGDISFRETDHFCIMEEITDKTSISCYIVKVIYQVLAKYLNDEVRLFRMGEMV